VVAQIDPEILLIEAKRSASRLPTDATAYDLVLRAIPLIGRLEREPFMLAGEHLHRATEMEPDYAAAYAWHAYWQMFLVGQGWAADPSAAMEEAGQHAERAVLLDPLDARGLTIAGHVRAFLNRRLREALTLHERALSLNPNLAMAWALSAIAYAYMGDPEEAERRNNRYKKLSPFDPHAFFFDGFFTVIYLLKRDFESAVVAGRAVTEMNPALSAGYKPYLAALGHLGHIQEAAVVRQATGSDFILVTPGIRLAADASDDQARVVTPREAVRLGADYLVIGRPITGSPDPAATLQSIRDSLDEAHA